jgi:hypothetical protein
MFIAGIEDEKWLQDKHSFWDNVYGFRMSCAQNANKNEPLVDTLSNYLETKIFLRQRGYQYFGLPSL